jgi:type II secretory pathway component PulC
MAKEISPEERLLSLIKNKNKKINEPVPSQETKNEPVVSIASKADERISGILKSVLFKNRFFEPSRLKKMNRYLVAILCLLILYFIVDIIVVKPYKDVQLLIAKTQTNEESQKSLPSNIKDAVAVKDYSSYSNAVPGRTVFGPAQGGASEDVAPAGSVSERVGLVGIITGDNPQAIIEDKKAQKTYYLNKGQSFEGYVLEEIADGKVILDYEDKKISLFL